MITTDPEVLSQKCEPVSLADGRAISRKLVTELDRHNKRVAKRPTKKNPKVEATWSAGVGLSAPQIGINGRVFVLKHAGRVYSFINPRVVAHAERTMPYVESCLSLPGKVVKTERHFWVDVACDNIPGVQRFGCATVEDWQNRPEQSLLAVAVQHELDHLDGLTIDRFQQGGSAAP